MTPDWRTTATRFGVGALAPFVSPVLPDGDAEDQEVREQVSTIARDGDGRLLPVVAAAAGIEALRARRGPLEIEAAPEPLAIEAGPERLALDSSGWTPETGWVS